MYIYICFCFLFSVICFYHYTCMPIHFYMYKYILVSCTSMMPTLRDLMPCVVQNHHIFVQEHSNRFKFGVVLLLLICSVHFFLSLSVTGDTTVQIECAFSRLFYANQFGKLRPIKCMRKLWHESSWKMYVSFAQWYFHNR